LKSVERVFLYAAINGFLVVVFGAFGAHGLEGVLSEARLETWQTAVLYHMFHVVALLAAGFLAYLLPASKSMNRAAYAFQLGILLFSGSLYVLALTDISALGYITPFGGLAFLLGWCLLIYGLIRKWLKSS
jgi:uncharacterized membrane protein YgdD (TMEM256/DUF423 family)